MTSAASEMYTESLRHAAVRVLAAGAGRAVDVAVARLSGERSASLLRIARILVQAGLEPEQITNHLAERDATLGWHKYSERENVAVYYRRLVDAVARGERTRRMR